MSVVYWLASYPKSGNTWCRLLIANLRRDTPVPINDLHETGGIASARRRFDEATLIPSGLLTHDECDRLRPQLDFARAPENADDDAAVTTVEDRRFIKTHDAYSITCDGVPILGGSKMAAGVILLVRDPRDVVASFSSHLGTTIEWTIDLMAADDAALCNHHDRQPTQLRQKLGGWSAFVGGWLGQRDLPVHLLRYEDLQSDPAGTIRAALCFAGIDVTSDEAARAAHFADFGEVRRQEIAGGFREAPRAITGEQARPFFRRGRTGGWQDELSKAQSARIERDHGVMMKLLGYAPGDLQGVNER